MWQRVSLVIVLGLAFLILGKLQPGAVLLDAPFGIAYFLAEWLGKWRPGPIWVGEHPELEMFCFSIWPLIASMLIACGVTFIATRLWLRGARYSRLYAVGFLAIVFTLVIVVRVQPGHFRLSYFGHWAENY